MADCDVCGEGSGRLSYTCNYCGGEFCSDHRLPENHGCTGENGEAEPAGMAISRSARHRYERATNDGITSSTSWIGRFTRPYKRWFRNQSVLGLLIRTVVIALVVIAALIGVGIATGIGPVEMADVNGLVDDASDSASDIGPDIDDGASIDGQDEDELNRSQIELHIHQGINDRRANHGLDTLSFDTQLREIARYHSRDMAVNDYFAHDAPDGESMTDRYDQFNYSCRAPTGNGSYLTGAENIAFTYYDTRVETESGMERYENEQELAEGLVKQWMNSEGHRENILTPHWEKEGIGVYIEEQPDGKIRVYATQNFC